MGEAAPRRASWRVGDFLFNAFAAALGLALLFATGRHLFAASYTEMPAAEAQAGTREASVIPVAGQGRLTVSPHVRGALRAAMPFDRTPRRLQLPLAIRASDVAPRASRAPLPAHRGAAPGAVLAAPRALVRAVVKPRATVRRASGTPVRRPAPHRVSVRPSRATRFAPAAPRHGTVREAHAPAAAARASRGDSHARRERGLVLVAGAGHRVPRARNARTASARARAIVEPPLGYDAQPSLVIAPAAAQLDLGNVVLPTLRSNRRH